jgi:hypothetical protein
VHRVPGWIEKLRSGEPPHGPAENCARLVFAQVRLGAFAIEKKPAHPNAGTDTANSDKSPETRRSRRPLTIHDSLTFDFGRTREPHAKLTLRPALEEKCISIRHALDAMSQSMQLPPLLAGESYGIHV